MLTKRHSNRTFSSYSYKKNESSTGKRGFTLVELLIVIVVGLIITAGVVSIMWVYIFDFEQTDDITAARQRGEMVLSILEGPILHAGLAMPNESPDFADSFNSFNTLFSTMTEPVIPSDGESNDKLHICYSLPSSRFVNSSQKITSVDMLVSIDQIPTLQEVAHDGSTFKSWISFPTAQIPFLIKSGETSATLTISRGNAGDGSGIIAQYDELHYVRAIHAYVSNGQFYTQDMTISSAQPRVDGVEKIYFVNDGGVLSVYVLTRGNKIDAGLATDRSIPGWDEDLLPDIDTNSKKYRLSVTKGSWRIRN